MKALFAVIIVLAVAAPAVADSPTSSRLTDQDRPFYGLFRGVFARRRDPSV